MQLGEVHMTQHAAHVMAIGRASKLARLLTWKGKSPTGLAVGNIPLAHRLEH
jgi:hypothetical protein